MKRKTKVYKKRVHFRRTGDAPTDLRQWAEWKQITLVELAKRLEISRQYLSGILNQRIAPSRWLREYIEKITGKRVRADSWPPRCVACGQTLPGDKDTTNGKQQPTKAG